MFEGIIGNDKIKEELTQAVKLNKFSHSYIFLGTDGIGKKLIAREFAKMIMCSSNSKYCNKCKSCIEFNSNNNPDFQEIVPDEDKIKVLCEAKRITKNGGLIFVAYYMNEYAAILHGFRDGKIKQSLAENRLDKNLKIICKDDDLYSFERLSDINKYNKLLGLKRVEIFAPDGPSDYMRDVLNKMDDETFEIFKRYQLQVSSKKELLGASSHLVDVVKNVKT